MLCAKLHLSTLFVLGENESKEMGRRETGKNIVHSLVWLRLWREKMYVGPNKKFYPPKLKENERERENIGQMTFITFSISLLQQLLVFIGAWLSIKRTHFLSFHFLPYNTQAGREFYTSFPSLSFMVLSYQRALKIILFCHHFLSNQILLISSLSIIFLKDSNQTKPSFFFFSN